MVFILLPKLTVWRVLQPDAKLAPTSVIMSSVKLMCARLTSAVSDVLGFFRMTFLPEREPPAYSTIVDFSLLKLMFSVDTLSETPRQSNIFWGYLDVA